MKTKVNLINKLFESSKFRQAKNKWMKISLFVLSNKLLSNQSRALLKYFNAYKLSNLSEIGEVNETLYSAIAKAESHAPTFLLGDESKNKSEQSSYKKDFKFYVTKLNQCFLVGGSSIIFFERSHLALYDLLELDNKNLKFTDQGMKYSRSEFFIPKINSKIKPIFIDCAINLVANYSWNYYHLLVEILTKFLLIEEYILDSKIPIIVDDVIEKVPQFKELLQLFNREKNPVITISKNQIVKCKQIYHISPLNYITPNLVNESLIQVSDNFFTKQSLVFVRKRLLQFKSDKKFPKRIYISRENASGRRNFNEGEILVELAKFGFQKVFPEKLSIAEQLSLFNNAEIIVGGSGAAFTNLIFCNTDCQVIILARDTSPFSGFSGIAKILKLNVTYVTQFSEPSPGGLHDEFFIERGKISFVINNLLNL